MSTVAGRRDSRFPGFFCVVAMMAEMSCKTLSINPNGPTVGLLCPQRLPSIIPESSQNHPIVIYNYPTITQHISNNSPGRQVGFLARLALLSATDCASRWTQALHLWPKTAALAEAGAA